MKNKKGFIAAGVLVFIYILSGIVAGGFAYVAYKDVTAKVKCGSVNCNGGNLAGGVQAGQ
jgi:hypothetical protein